MSTLKIQGVANSDKITIGETEIRKYSSRQILNQVLMKLGLYWGLAIFSVLLPVVHFVLVPLFLFLGIFTAYRARRIRVEILFGKIECPHCGKLVTIPTTAAQWPHSEICQCCCTTVRISPIDE
jgi:hypothetical protein